MYHSSNNTNYSTAPPSYYDTNTNYSFAQPPSNNNNNYYSFAQPSTGFVAAPAPILRDDGEITVISNATRTLPMTAPPPTEITIYGAPSTDLLAASAMSSSTYSHPTPTPQYSENTYNKYALQFPSTARSITPPNTSATTSAYARKPLTEHVQNTALTSTTSSIRSTDSYRATTTSTQIVPFDADAARQEPHQTYPELVEEMKIHRKRATVAAGVTGGAVGLLVLGPVGMVVGAAGASVATRTIGKRRERKMREKISDQRIAEQAKNAPLPLAMTGGELL